MEQIGYSLLDLNHNEVQHWGNNLAVVFQDVPSVIALPNGDRVHAPALYGTYGGLQLVKRFYQESTEQDSVTFNGTDIVVNCYVAPAPPPSLDPPSVLSCTPLQARKALRQVGLIDAVNAAVKASTPDVQDAWEFASEVRRNDPFLVTLSTSLGMTSQQLDALFVLAASF